MASQDWFEKDFYAILGVPQDADAARDQEGLPQARPQAPPRPERRGRGGRAALQGDRRGERRSLRPRAAPAVRRHPRDGARRRPLPAGGPGRQRRLRGRLLRPFGGGGDGQRVRFTRRAGRPGDAGQPDLRRPARADVRAGRRRRPGPGRRTAAPTRSPGSPRPAAREPAPTCRPARRCQLPRRRRGCRRSPCRPPRAAGSRRRSLPASRTVRRSGCAARAPRATPVPAKGDLILTVTVDKHPVFGRDGDNLTVDLPVTFAEAALGATVSVPTLDGTPVRVKVAPGTPSGRVLRVKGRGVKRPATARGDLLAKVRSSCRSGSPTPRATPSRRCGPRRPRSTRGPSSSSRPGAERVGMAAAHELRPRFGPDDDTPVFVISVAAAARRHARADAAPVRPARPRHAVAHPRRRTALLPARRRAAPRGAAAVAGGGRLAPRHRAHPRAREPGDRAARPGGRAGAELDALRVSTGRGTRVFSVSPSGDVYAARLGERPRHDRSQALVVWRPHHG